MLSGYRRRTGTICDGSCCPGDCTRRNGDLGFELALSGHHFIRYARPVAESLEAEIRVAKDVTN